MKKLIILILILCIGGISFYMYTKNTITDGPFMEYEIELDEFTYSYSDDMERIFYSYILDFDQSTLTIQTEDNKEVMDVDSSILYDIDQIFRYNDLSNIKEIENDEEILDGSVEVYSFVHKGETITYSSNESYENHPWKALHEILDKVKGVL